MPVPVRDDGRPGPTRRLLVFVHGFCSSRDTWATMRARLDEDPAIGAEYDIAYFEYETAIAAAPVVGALPTLEEAGESLAAWLTTSLFDGTGTRYIDATLVGHSMGGLIVQSAILDMLRPDGALRTLQHIRQAILFATPNFGSGLGSTARRVLSVLARNDQEQALRTFSPEAVRIHEEIRDRVIFATQRGRDEYPLPVYCFSGRTDGVVTAESARGHFPAGEPLPGGHFDLHCPPSRDDPRYTQFVSALRAPHGHQNVWEVEHFLFGVKVSPVPTGTQVTAQYGTKSRVVTCDNVATVVRRVTFSPHNRCRRPYVLKYGTRNGGWIVPRVSEPHVTPPDKRRLYDDTGTDCYYEVEPRPATTSRLDLTLYKGFDDGHRDFHMHLGRSTYYRRVTYEVDLSDYRAAGWSLTAPRLYVHLTDPGDHALCAERTMINADPPASVDPRGIWRWDLEFLTEGVVDLVFDVEPPADGVQPRLVTLEPGEHAVFGYGSLLSIESLEKTLGRSYTGPFLVCDLVGWRRRWNVAMPNTTFVYRDRGGWVTPEHIFYLNVERSDAAHVTGILFVVTAEELARFDQREWIYDRVDVTTQLPHVRLEGGSAWVYCGKPPFVRPHPPSASAGAIRRTYLKILDAGHHDLGEAFAKAYAATTDAVPPHLVVDDVRRDD